MPEFHARYKRIITTVELVDVKITADSAEEAAEKMHDLLDSDSGATNSGGRDMEEVLDEGAWEHDADGDGWERVTPFSLEPPAYKGEKTDPVDLTDFKPFEYQDADPNTEEGEA